MNKPALVLFLILFLLSACAPASTPAASAEPPQPPQVAPPSPTATQVVESVTLENTATPTPVPATSTPVPTLAFEGELNAGATTLSPVDGAVMVFIPAGDFTMGADADDLLAKCQAFRSDCRREWFTNVEPPRTVTLDAFWMDQTEVSNRMYKSCVDTGACTPPFRSDSYTRDSYFGNPQYDDYPVIYVSWEQANAYCSWAGRRLPTEAEWEKAARGTDGRLFPWGDTLPNTKLLNFALVAGDTTSVTSYPGGVSPYGLYNMAGNVWEWTSDWYDENYYKAAPSLNPQGPASGEFKVLRGSAWIYLDFDAFVTDRYGNDPKTTNNVIGFRCARSR